MGLIRFASARDLFDAYPAAREDVEAKPDGQPPLAFLQALAVGPTPEDAVSFCAYLLPRREAVWWACGCVRGLSASRADLEADPSFQAAEAWVRDPCEERRVEALKITEHAPRQSPATWLAFAAAWSGGSILLDGPAPVPAAPHLTAKAVRAAIFIALARVPTPERVKSIQRCVEHGLALVAREQA